MAVRVRGGMLKSRMGPWLNGLNLKSPPSMISEGELAGGQNVLLDEKPGSILTRNGSRTLSQLPSGNPARDCYTFHKSTGTTYFLASDGTTLYYTTDPSSSAAWTQLKTGLNSDAFLEFETAEDRVWMFNGTDKPMSWDGTTLVIHDRAQTVDGSSSNNTSITTTTFRNAALTQDDDYWNGQKIVFTSGTHEGEVVTVTDFDAATDEVTFTPALASIGATDDFQIGVEIPNGRIPRFWDGHLFVFSTADNPAEGRFNSLTDTIDGTDITIDHPQAWPATNQVDVYSQDGDRVWAASPVMRDRFLIAKSTGLFRLERDPLTVYRIEAVGRGVGSRFHRSWVERDGTMYFVGQRIDRLPDVFKSDMYDVAPVDPRGRMDPVLRDLRQPNAVQQSRVFTDSADFLTGTFPMTAGFSTDAGIVKAAKLDSKDALLAALQSGTNVDLESTPGYAAVLGYPVWTTPFDGASLATDAGWTRTLGSAIQTPYQATSGGIFIFGASSVSLSGDPTITYTKEVSGDITANDVFLRSRFKLARSGIPFQIDIGNGSDYAEIVFLQDGTTTVNGAAVSSLPSLSDYRDVAILLKANGVLKIWAGSTLTVTSTSTSGTFSGIRFGGITGTTEEVFIDWLNFHTNFLGDKLSSQGGKISQTTMPSSLPTSGTLVLQYDKQHDGAASSGQNRVAFSPSAIDAESWTSQSSGFASGNDVAGYVTFASGAAPSSLDYRYQRIRFTLDESTDGTAEALDWVINRTSWKSPWVFIGSNIAAWRSVLLSTSIPTGAGIDVAVEYATTEGTPGEGDALGPGTIIASGDNIGTYLVDTTPPSARWARFIANINPGTSGDSAGLDAAVLQWTEGSDVNLPLGAIAHKGRLLIYAATGGSAKNDIVIVLDRNDAWMQWKGLNPNGLFHFLGQLIGPSSADDFMILYDQEEFQDRSAAIDAFVDSGEDSLGAEERRKAMAYSYVHGGARAYSLTLSYKRPEFDSDFTGAKTVAIDGNGEDVRVAWAFGLSMKRLQRRYRCAVLGQGMDLRGETLYYRTRGPQPV